MGGGGGGGSGAGDAARMQAELAQRLVSQTDPLREALLQRSQGFLDGGSDVTSTPMFQAFKGVTESQFQNARNNVIGATPTGGPLVQALTNLEGNRAMALGQGAGALEEAEIARAMSLATGTTGQAMSGLGQAGSIQAMLAQSNADRDAGLYGALGTGLGAWMGSK